MILGLLLFGCTNTPPKEGAVLVVTVDGVRADRLGIHGHNPSETPNIDAFAKTGTKFSRAYAVSTSPQSAFMSVLLGLSPPVHGFRVQGDKAIDKKSLRRDDGLLSHLEEDGFSWSLLDWDPTSGNFSGFEVGEGRSPDVDVWIVRMPPMTLTDGHAMSELEYDSMLHSYDAHVGQVLEYWEAYRPDGHTFLVGVTGSLNGARDDAAVALTDDILRIPLIVNGPGVEQDWEVVDVVSSLDVPATVAKFLDLDFDGHGQFLLTGGSKVAYHESTYGYQHFGARPVVGYTFTDGRYEESVFGRVYPASDNVVRTFHIPISEHPTEARVLRDLQASFGKKIGLPSEAWSSKLDSSECVGLDTLSKKALKALDKGRPRAAERMIDRIKQQAPDAPIIQKLERHYQRHVAGQTAP